MEDNEIIEIIKNLFGSADERNWQKVKSVFEKEVLLDHTSMNGGEPSKLTPDEIANARAAFLPGFDSTHHQLSGFMLNVNGDNVTAHYKGKADHYLNNDMWTAENTYNTKLKV